MMRNRYAAVCLFLMFFALTVQAQDDPPRNEVEVRGTFSIPSGESMFTRNGITGSTIDFSRDFDFGNELGYEIRYTYKSENKRHKIVADWAETNWERTRTLSRSFTFLGQTYVANLDATAGLTLREFRAMYSYRWGTEKFRIGPMADMGVISTRLNITGTTNQGTRSGEVTTTKFAATLGY